MPRGTQVPAVSLSGSGTGLSPALAKLSSFLPLPTQESRSPALLPRTNESARFGLFPLRSPLLRESRLISFPSGTEMFHFPEFANLSVRRLFTSVRLPYSEIPGSKDVRLLAEAFRSLPRLSSPSDAQASARCSSLLFARKKLPSFPMQLLMSRPLRVSQARA